MLPFTSMGGSMKKALSSLGFAILIRLWCLKHPAPDFSEVSCAVRKTAALVYQWSVRAQSCSVTILQWHAFTGASFRSELLL